MILGLRQSFIAVALLLSATAGSQEGGVQADAVCLGCHSIEGLAKQLPDGDTLSLHVSADAFRQSVHGKFGCAACHADIDLAVHPGQTRDIQSRRQYSIERAEACRMCHAEAAEQHDGSLHAARVREGDPLAPVCTGCHGDHAVTPRTAYETCVRCHSADLAAHRDWLPNAGLHQEVVSCAACHAPQVPRMIDLRLYDGAAGQWVVQQEGAPPFEQLAAAADANGDGLDAMELSGLLAQINRDAPSPRTLRGRVELREAVQAHRLTAKEQALRACDNCHRYGSEPFQTVAVSIVGADGRPRRYAARQDVLGSPQAVAALPEFYAIGGTRSRFLDALFLLALAGGIGFPLAHMTVKWLFRKHRAGSAGGGNGAT
jgi:hypothetical protein